MVTEFTPWPSMLGGAMIGLAAVLLLALHGRLFGATRILGGLLRLEDPADWRLRATVLAGMMLGPLAVAVLTGEAAAIEVPVPGWALAVGGVLVGLGVSYGGGCPSGHGVCGIARLSRRSVVATGVFMATAALTVLAIRHLGGA